MIPNSSSFEKDQRIKKNRQIRLHELPGCLVVFDFDGTLTKSNYRSSWQSVHEYFDTWESHGKLALELFLEGKLSYKEFCEADAFPWINRSEQEYQKALSTIELRNGFSEMVDFFKRNDCKLAIISMGLADIVKKTAEEYAFDYWIANDIIRNNNLITGEVVINVNMHKKGEIFSSIQKKFNINPNSTIAVGDASADIEMFSTAYLSFVIDPSSDKVAESADYVLKSDDLKEIISYFS